MQPKLNTREQAIHEKTQEVATRYQKCQSELVEWLDRVDRLKIYLSLEFASLYAYCIHPAKRGGLGLSEGCAYNLIQVSRKARQVPQLKQALDAGSITLSKARRLAPVITPTNQEAWIATAQRLPQRELERVVAEASPDAGIKERLRPTGLKRTALVCEISKELELKIKHAQDLLSQKQRGNKVSLEKTLEALVEGYLEKHDPVRRAKRVAEKKTPSKSIAKRIAAKPQPHPQRLGERQAQRRKPIPSREKHLVHLRDGGKCTYHNHKGVRCNETRYLELHHKVPVSLGGPNTHTNLASLCASHHLSQHRKDSCRNHRRAVPWTPRLRERAGEISEKRKSLLVADAIGIIPAVRSGDGTC